MRGAATDFHRCVAAICREAGGKSGAVFYCVSVMMRYFVCEGSRVPRFVTADSALFQSAGWRIPGFRVQGCFVTNLYQVKTGTTIVV